MAQCLETLVSASTIYRKLSKCMKKWKLLHLTYPVVLSCRSLTHMDSSINFRSSVPMRKTRGVQSVVLYQHPFMQAWTADFLSINSDRFRRLFTNVGQIYLAHSGAWRDVYEHVSTTCAHKSQCYFSLIVTFLKSGFYYLKFSEKRLVLFESFHRESEESWGWKASLEIV